MMWFCVAHVYEIDDVYLVNIIPGMICLVSKMPNNSRRRGVQPSNYRKMDVVSDRPQFTHHV